jgi:hypothetical protein
MYHLLLTLKNYIFGTPMMYLYVPFDSRNQQRLFIQNCINRLGFVMKILCVFFEFLNAS